MELPYLTSSSRVRLTPFSARVEAAGLTAAADLDAFLAARPDLIIECAGHSAVEAYVPDCLSAGIKTVIASIGALTDTALYDRIVAAAASSGARAILAPGAVGGIDLLSALRVSGIDAVRYTGRKGAGETQNPFFHRGVPTP